MLKLATKRAAFAVLAALALALGTLATGGCAGIIPAVVQASIVASEVLAWIDRIVSFLAPAPLDTDTRRAIDIAVDRARAAATALHHAARAGEQAERGELDSAKRDALAAVQALLDLVAPFGVHPMSAGMGTYGLDAGGRELIVPTAAEMVGL